MPHALGRRTAVLKVSVLGVEEQRVNVIVDFTTPATERANLGDAYQLEARIVVWESANALKVPTSALFRQSADWATLALEGNRARLHWPNQRPRSGTPLRP